MKKKDAKTKTIIGPYKEVVLYETQNGKQVEVRRIKFRLTETEAALIRRKKELDKKLIRMKVRGEALAESCRGINKGWEHNLTEPVSKMNVELARWDRMIKEDIK